jgi:hypothetical protein
MLFTFAGSSNPKYTTYLLEFLTNFELESSKELREGILNSMLVNLSGREGGFSAGDLIQEFFNRLLEAIVERKGADFGATFIREIVSRNLHHMGRVKTDLREGVGLSARSGHHTDPHTNPEVKTLLQQYARHELHSRRPGRTIDDNDVDDFAHGWDQLMKSKLKKWVAETTRARGMRSRTADVPLVVEKDDEEGSMEDDGEVNVPAPSFGSSYIVDGRLVIEVDDSEEVLRQYMAFLEAEENVDDGEEGEDPADSD